MAIPKRTDSSGVRKHSFIHYTCIRFSEQDRHLFIYVLRLFVHLQERKSGASKRRTTIGGPLEIPASETLGVCTNGVNKLPAKYGGSDMDRRNRRTVCL